MSECGEIPVDAHVHLHACFSPARFFDAALANLHAVATTNGSSSAIAGCLLLTESHGVDTFGMLLRRAAGLSENTAHAEPGATHATGAEATDGDSSEVDAVTSGRDFGDWEFEATSEGNSLWATHGRSDTSRLLLVAGRQLETREKLEVLALGCSTELDDGMELRAAIDATSAAGAVPVIPWGFGKWWGRRGKLLAALLGDTDERTHYFLGDNGGRAAMLPQPTLFRRAAQHGVLVLPGSDPLPFASQTSRAGSCGLRLGVDLDEEQPAAAVLEALRRLDRQPTLFGRYETLPGFVRSQVAMQLRKVSA